ncbi:YdcF family protein [Deltaproteobacteria bacterium TL4]
MKPSKKLIKGCVVLSVVGLLILNYQWFFRNYAEFLTIDNATKNSDAIIILSGNPLIRIPHALKLFQEQYSGRIFLTDEKKNYQFSHLFPSNLELAVGIAKELNVTIAFEIIPSLKGGATSTFDEAQDLKEYVRIHALKRVILVTDAFHTRRARYAFNKVLGNPNLKIEMSAAPNPIFAEGNWWKSELGMENYTLEGLKFLVYLSTSQNLAFIWNN